MSESQVSPEKMAEWKRKAQEKGAVVPRDFEVFPTKVTLSCGNCGTAFVRNLVPYVNEPVFACPNGTCQTKNWVPVRYEMRR